MERDTQSLGPCGEVVRGILGDRFKVGVSGGCGGGGGGWWLVVVFVVGFWFLFGCCEGGRGRRMRAP